MPGRTSLRKRPLNDIDETVNDAHENGHDIEVEAPPQKWAKATSQKPAQANSKAAPKGTAPKTSPRGGSKTAAKSKGNQNAAFKLYTSTLADVDKARQTLDLRVKKQDPNAKFCIVTAATYAAVMAKIADERATFMLTKEAIDADIESRKLAMNLLLDLGQHVHGDFAGHMRHSGRTGDCDDSLAKLDGLMLSAIELRVAAESSAPANAPVEAENNLAVEPLPQKDAANNTGD